MDEESFLLPVDYRGEELELQTTLKPYGYTYRFEVNINGILVQFEPDEEGSYRALVTAEEMQANAQTLQVELLQAVAHTLEALRG